MTHETCGGPCCQGGPPTPLADEVVGMWDSVKHNGEALGAIQAALDETKGNVDGYPAALRRIQDIANEWEKKHG